MIEMTQLSVIVMTCPFRSCNWQSEDTRTMTLADQEHITREHLQHHRTQIRLMARALDDE